MLQKGELVHNGSPYRTFFRVHHFKLSQVNNMNLKGSISAVLISFFMSSGLVWAQDSDTYHPMLTDTFVLGVGAFWAAESMEIEVDGSTPGDEFDFNEALNLDDNKTTGAMNFKWRFGEKWSLQGQYWSLDNSGGGELEDPIKWGDITFKEGTFAKGGVDKSVARIFFGRTFSTSNRHEFGLGAGFHWMELDLFLEGQILTSEGDTEFYRGDADAAFPLPNVGGWYLFSWSSKWLMQARLDWLSASVGDYSGGLWNAQLGINYQAFEHVGFGLYYNAFVVDVDVDKTDWRGKAESTQHGPFLAVTFNW